MYFHKLIILLWGCLLSHGFPFLVALPPVVENIGSVVYQTNEYMYCLIFECCKKAVYFNASKLRLNLKQQLHGQHIAEERLYHHIKAHYEDPSPRKALVLSLHGFTGIGKNYAASIIVKNVLKNGEKSVFYHFYDATLHFPFKDLLLEYKKQLQTDITNAVSKCSFSIFVFDEVHKMPTGLLDAIVPFLGYTKSIDGTDYRKSVYIFIGNSGGLEINRYTFDTLSEGKPRLSIAYADLRRNLFNSAFQENGAFYQSTLISQHLITAVVPFLPLQEVHIRKCIGDAAKRMGIETSDDLNDFVIKELDWGPEGTKMFSESGCKLIYEKVGFFMQRSVYDIHAEL